MTVQDVARLAGVSPGTVSRVFNGNVPVREQTKRKVLEAATQLNYRPNFIAQGLRMKKSQTIGLIVPELHSEGFVQVIKAIESVIYEQGYSLILCSSDEDPEREKANIQTLIHRNIDGLILCPVSTDVTSFDELSHTDIPFVLLDRMIDGIETDIIKGNDQLGCYEATKYLVELGHEKIGVLSKPPTIPFVVERLLGYQNALEDCGIPYHTGLVRFSSHFSHHAMQACEELLTSEKPTAIFSMSSTLTMSLLKVVKKLNLSIPDDISIIGYGESEWNSLLNPPLTAVGLNGNQMGTIAANMLFRRIREGREKRGFETVLLPVSLSVRSSCRSH
ncbi:LacI family transcriptional regulator [Alicyclobacillus tolerans]|uniref:LacI family DNA-binding transcriptional regulator n=1 Tax=Alicyclobacillus tolerans TaxID=90970 RepID=UPI001F3A996E|nr:LacI family DNA-binding transcriptional regulator [Alicyclobacillus tolerans]MCF8568469.1 LacI family transcriptional regulator [Alicyclobacillus tolerans]